MQSYLNYLEKVLGLKSVVLPPREALSETETGPIKCRVLFVSENPLSQKAMELLQKMREAMKLESESVKIISASEISAPELQVLSLSAEKVVCFSKTLYDTLAIEDSQKFYTHNPEELLKKPELKKPTWEDLKQVMKSLGISL